MSERNGPRNTLFGLLLTTGLSVFTAQAVLADDTANTTATARPALESLKELDGKAPARRALNIQTWQTAEGAKVLFVEARELPMFDMRLTFAAGSSQDQTTPGIAVLTNAMLNEGVKGKDVTAIAQGFDGLGADFGNGAYRDMAVASIRSLSAPDKREPALKLFSEVVGKPTFPADSLARIKNQLLARSRTRARWPVKSCSSACTAITLTATQAKAPRRLSRRSPSLSSRPSMPRPMPLATP
jgi:zinc protease